MDVRARLARAAGLIASHLDVLEARPADGEPPEAIERRGWIAYLAALPDDALARLEVEGVAATHDSSAPSALRALWSEAQAVCALPSPPSEATPTLDEPVAPARPRRSPRKASQVEAFVRHLMSYAGTAARVLDVGSGHGHLTRELAERLGRPVIGLERDPRLVARARALGGAEFTVADVLLGGLPVAAGDCLVGLHACGELGDAMTRAAADAGASIGLLGCCLQKRQEPSRVPLTTQAPALTLPTRLLGLSNLSARDQGVEASREENLRARERRLALHRLLAARLGPMRFGQEIDGLNRRAAHLTLEALVARAFDVRGLVRPTDGDVVGAARWARVAHARARRFSLPRAVLARVLEVFVLCDRGTFLADRGYAVRVGSVFDEAISPRNLGLFGVARPRRPS